ncbi:RagB/SusD family nutrient uptake outer membrane protein [Tunicatimonas pelagia]|uniref:RagB/SusD family nutrient uptake outer membrane protein n=1 Tax=Tunicatimonas pelagia TaxID=931531 RepID=UPI0026670C5B|nr:RagB/SusD family nutrient uptake outer membrane protein [Tunicatimonas pelagia]WKN45005.1 RagB/SusD family nutrient uptake outer membrane protein [Tunicatimonas pelagia]
MKIIHQYLLLFLSLLLTVACDDLLEEDPPSNIGSTNFYETEEDALAGLYGAYNSLYDVYSPDNVINYGEINADDLTISPIVPDRFEWDNFTYNSEITGGLWNSAYQGINRANEVIVNTEAIDFEAGRKADLIAEAQALRALYYFALVRAIGGVPLYETPTTSFDNIYAPRASEEDVYALVIRDLEAAANELESESLAGRINSGVANAYLARVHLYLGNYQEALTHAQNIINSGQYQLLPDYAAVFDPQNNNSAEHIFQIQYLSGERNNNLPSRFGPRMPAGGEFTNSFWAGTTIPGLAAPTDEFIAESPVSYRRSVTIADQYEHIDGVTGTITMEEIFGGEFPFYISKFDDRTGELQSGMNLTLFRYADILLIAAEAMNEVEAGSNQKYDWINQVRTRARNGVEENLPNLAGLSQEVFREAVLEERRFELAFEGQRAWDLKRRGLFLEAVRDQEKTVMDFMLLFPVPDDQVQLNNNLEQNTGWE